MNFKVVQIEKYGSMVFQHPQMDELRRSQCLCFNCHIMTQCKIAAAGYELCRKNNVAFAMTRCQKFESKLTPDAPELATPCPECGASKGHIVPC